MLYRKFTKLVEEHADYLTQRWLLEVKSNPSTAGYSKISDEVLTSRVYDVYKKLSKWLSDEDPSFKKAAEHFIALGRERANEGLHVSEIIYALVLSRAVIWNYLIEQGLINNSIELQLALHFYQKMNNYFDKAAYFVAVGFESASKNRNDLIERSDFLEKSVNAIAKWIIKIPQ